MTGRRYNASVRLQQEELTISQDLLGCLFAAALGSLNRGRFAGIKGFTGSDKGDVIEQHAVAELIVAIRIDLVVIECDTCTGGYAAQRNRDKGIRANGRHHRVAEEDDVGLEIRLEGVIELGDVANAKAAMIRHTCTTLLYLTATIEGQRQGVIDRIGNERQDSKARGTLYGAVIVDTDTEPAIIALGRC